MSSSYLSKFVLSLCWLICNMTDTSYKYLQKLLCIVLIILYMIGFLIYAFFRERNVYITFFVLAKYTEDFNNVLVLLACAVTNLNVVFIKPQCFHRISHNQKEFDRIIGGQVETKTKLQYLIFLLDQMQILPFILLERYFFPTTYPLFHLASNIEMYLLDITRLVIFWMTFKVYTRLKLLKTSLKCLEKVRISRNN